MATTSTIKPKTLEQVLAEQKAAVTPVVSETKGINQAQAESNKAKAAEREAARQNANVLENYGTGVINDERDSSDTYTNKGKQYQIQSGTDFYIGNSPEEAQAKKEQAELERRKNPIKAPVVAPVIKEKAAPTVTGDIDKARTQVGKIVSDFKNTLSTSADKDAFYAGINYANLGKQERNIADRLLAAQEKTNAKKEATSDANKDLYDTYEDTLTDAVEKSKDQYDVDKDAAIDAEKAAKDTMDAFTQAATDEIESAFNMFRTEQDALVRSYEGNRLNQVQGDLRRALANRGVDVSKIPQEQLIALSGEIGAKAFSDISAAKERATVAIESARQNRIAKLNELRSANAINDATYKKQLANINSTANQAKNNLDLKLAETVFGIQSAQDTKKETTQANTAQAILSTAQSLGLSGSQFGLISKYINGKESTPEALQTMFLELQNPQSQLYQILLSNEDAVKKQQAFKNEIDMLEAQAKLKSAGRSASSTPIVNVYGGQ